MYIESKSNIILVEDIIHVRRTFTGIEITYRDKNEIDISIEPSESSKLFNEIKNILLSKNKKPESIQKIYGSGNFEEEE